MPKFRVEISTLAIVGAVVEVEAETEEFAFYAVDELVGNGEITWVYEGVDESAEIDYDIRGVN